MWLSQCHSAIRLRLCLLFLALAELTRVLSSNTPHQLNAGWGEPVLLRTSKIGPTSMMMGRLKGWKVPDPATKGGSRSCSLAGGNVDKYNRLSLGNGTGRAAQEDQGWVSRSLCA